MATISTQPTAATHFFNLPELVKFVAEFSFRPYQYGIIPTLASLRLVNRTCNLAATPYTFQELRIQESIAYTRSRGRLNPRPDLVRRAFFSVCQLVGEETVKRPLGEEENLRDIISQMPRLGSFVLQFKYSGYVPTTSILQTLKVSCPNLKVLHVKYHEELNSDPSRRLDFDGFRGLRELVLYNLPFHWDGFREFGLSDCDWWITCLARLLIDSPALKKLSLGFEELSLFRMSEECINMFDELCHLYQTGGGSPLLLESLELLGGLFPFGVSPLKNLVDLASLQDVYISDCSLSNFGYPPPRKIAYEAFAPPYTPNLRNFRIDEYHRSLHEHFCAIAIANPSFTRRLAIAYKGFLRRTGLDASALLRPDPRHPSLPLQARMLDLDLDREHVYGERNDVKVSADEVLEDLARTNADTLEGLAVTLPNNENLKTEYQLQLLENALGRLPRLEQLSIGAPWRLDADTMVSMAERLVAAAGPRLRYLNIGDTFMQIRRGNDAGGGVPALEIIPIVEVDSVELWKYSLINRTSLDRLRW